MVKIKSLSSNWLTHINTEVLIFEDDMPVGISHIYHDKGSTNGQIHSLFVALPYRRKGYAKQMLEEAIKYCVRNKWDSVSIEWDWNEADGWVLDFYKRLGFQITDMNPERNTLLLVRNLK